MQEIVSALKAMFESLGFTAVCTVIATGLVTGLSAVFLEQIKAKNAIRLERIKNLQSEQIKAYKRLIGYSKSFADIYDPEDYFDLERLKNIYEKEGVTIVYDTGFHTEKIINTIDKIHRICEWAKWCHVDDSCREVEDKSRNEIPKLADELFNLAREELQIIIKTDKIIK